MFKEFEDGNEQELFRDILYDRKEAENSVKYLEKLTRKQLRAYAGSMTRREADHLIKMYYSIQDYRKRAESQLRSLELKEGVGADQSFLNGYLLQVFLHMETIIQKAMDDYTMAHPVGVWLRNIKGIGPVLAAGLLARINIEKAPTAGHIHSYAGYDPNVVWEKGKVRPFNANLKKLLWLIGQSFMKCSNRKDDIYGKVYKMRKEYENKRNNSGENAILAKELLPKFGKDTQAYQHLLKGKLPPAQIDARARRYAVKIFISHLHEVWFEWHYGQPAPKPFALDILGHAHYFAPRERIPRDPNMPILPLPSYTEIRNVPDNQPTEQ